MNTSIPEMNYGVVQNYDFNATINKIIDEQTQDVIDVCDLSYSTPKRIKWETDDRDKLLRYVCGKCGMEFGRESHYQQHLDNLHTELQTAKDLKMSVLSATEAECSICGTPVWHQTVRDLQAHHMLHLAYKSFKCQCHGYYFSDKAVALTHLDYEKAATPPVPSIESPSPQPPLEHFKRIFEDGSSYDPQYPETGIGYMCSECGNNCASEDLWKQHCNDTHDFKTLEGLNMLRLDTFSVRCNACGAVISGKWDNYKLRRHKLTHSPYKAFFCRLCKYSRKRKDDVLLHIRQMHVPRTTKYY